MRNAKHRFPTPESPRKGKGVSWADKEDEFDEFKLDRAMSRSGSPHMSSSEDDEPPTPATTPGDHESRCDVPGWDSDLTDISSLSDEEEAASGGEESDGSGDSSEDDVRPIPSPPVRQIDSDITSKPVSDSARQRSCSTSATCNHWIQDTLTPQTHDHEN